MSILNMSKENSKPSGDMQLQRMLGIRSSFTTNTQGIKKFISHLKPVIEETDKNHSKAMITAIQKAYDDAGVKFPSTKEEHENETEEQKKAIYRNLHIPELKSPSQGYVIEK